jgi:D-alanyl-lipoteichoic acid acyltransferase DltB (MBOAT superfamily)
VVIADSFAPWAINGFDIAEELNMLEAWATSLSYTFQLYFDFSGYTDMALGVALLFNIKLPENFNSPYKSLNIQEFWRRWHITLSRFLKDYIYIPLGGNRHGELDTYKNLMITFLLGGLWHGAGWTFIFWGFLHGAALVLNRLWCKLGFKMHNVLAWLITFNFVNVAWIFFRAKSWGDASKVLNGMFFGEINLPGEFANKLSFLTKYDVEFGVGIQKIGGNKEVVVGILIAFVIILALHNTNELVKSFKPKFVNLLFVSILFVYSIIAFLTIKSEFLYFDF